jgi:hypothetical protein
MDVPSSAFRATTNSSDAPGRSHAPPGPVAGRRTGRLISMLCAVPAMKISTLFGVPKMRLVQHYPELRPLHRAAVGRDWAAVATFFAELPAEHDPSVASGVLADL